jgi:hypothetical protein
VEKCSLKNAAMDEFRYVGVNNSAGGIVTSLVDNMVGPSAVIETVVGVSDPNVDSAEALESPAGAGADDRINHFRRSMAMIGRRLSPSIVSIELWRWLVFRFPQSRRSR